MIGNHSEEKKGRISLTWTGFGKLKHILKNKDIPVNLNKNIRNRENRTFSIKRVYRKGNVGHHLYRQNKEYRYTETKYDCRRYKENCKIEMAVGGACGMGGC